MEPNRSVASAELEEREATIGALRIAFDTRLQRIADARKNLEVLAAAAARARAAADANPLRALACKESLDAAIAERRARLLLEIAELPLTDDPDVRRLQGLLHPIRRLPDELLSDIFVEVVQGTEPEWDWKPLREPCRIAHVCKHWRGLALDTPRLWRHIRIKYDLTRKSNHFAGVTAVWIERSLHRNIDLSIGCSGEFLDTQRPPVLVPIRKALSNGAITSLRLYTPGITSIGRNLFPAGASSFSLQSLELTGYKQQQDLVDRLAHIAPNLQSITLTIIHFNSLPVQTHPNVRSARVVTTEMTSDSDSPTPEALAHLLAAFPALTNLTLDSCFMLGEVCDSALLRHDTLRSLHVYEPEGYDSELAVAYSFPQLRHAKIELRPWIYDRISAEDVYLDGPRQLLLHGLSTLHSLKFDVEIDMVNLLPALRNMPHLESLKCDRGHPDGEFCAALASPSSTSTGWLCPRLKLATLRMEPSEREECIGAISTRNDAQATGANIARVARLTSLSSKGTVMPASEARSLQYRMSRLRPVD